MDGLHFDITGDNSNFLRKLDEARNGIRSTSKQIEESGISIEQMFGRLAKGAAALGAGITAKEIVSNVVRIRGEFQQLEVAFNTMLGSKEKADTLMRQLVKTAAITPFDLQGVAGGAKQLLAYGTAAEDVNDTLIRLGDISAGLSIPLNDLVWLYGTTMTQGRLFTNDFRQFQSRGIPLADELAKQFGVTKDKVGELVTAGKVGFPEVQKAIVAMTNDGGKFGGLMEAQSKTITGQISNIEDSISTMYNNIGKQSEGFINEALSDVSYLVENYEQVGKTIMELAVTYGVYKAVLMSVAAYQSVATGITYSVEIAELSKLIPLKQQSANQDVVAAVASGKLTQSKAEQVIVLRAEIAAKIQSLQATEAQAKTEYVSAMASYKNATQRMLLAKQNMAIAQSQMSIAIKSGTADEIAAAKKNAQTASLELNNAAVVKNTAHKGLNIAATNSKSASEALNTVQTGLNSVSQNTNTISTNILTAAKTKLAAASKALGLSMLANPYALATAAIVGLGYGIYKLITYQTDAEKAQTKLNNSIREAEKASLSEHRELARLKGELSALTKGSDKYNAVKDKIIKNFGKYYSGLDTEIEKVGLTEQAYTKLIEAINKSFGARQYEKFASEQQEELSNTMAENLSNIQERLLNKLGDDYGSKIYAKIRNGITQGSLSLGAKPFEIQGLDDETKSALNKVAGKDGGLFDVTNRSIEGYIQNIVLANRATEQLDEKARNRFGIDDDSGKKTEDTKVQEESEKKAASEWLSSYKKAYEDADKAYNDFLKSKQVMFEADRDKELKRLKEERDTAKTTYGAKGGYTSSDTKQESAADTLRKQQESLRQQQEKYKLLMDKQKLDRQRQNEDLEHQAAQAEIDAMSDGFDKVQAQRDLNNKKEIQALKRQKEDYIRVTIQAEKEKFDAQEDINAKQIKDYDRKTFDSSSVTVDTSKWDKIIKDTETKQGLNEWEQREASMNEYLLKYGTFTQKKEAIDKKYRDAIGKESDLGNKNTLQKEWDESLSSLDMDKLKQEINWELIFGDLSKVSKKSLNEVKQQLKVFKDSDEYKNMTVEQKKVIDEALNNIQSTIIDKGGLLGDLPEQLDALRIAQEELNKAQEEYNDAIKNGTDAEKEAALKKKNKAEKNVQSAEVNVTKSADKTSQNLITLADTITQLGSSSEMSLSQIGSLASGLIGTFTEAGSKIGGIVGAAFSLLDGISKQGLDGFVENVFSSVFNAATGIWDTITFGAFSKITGSGESDINLEKDIESLAQSNHDLKNSLDNLSEKMEKASVAEALDIYDVQKENILKREANTRESMQRSGSAYSNGFLGIGGSHSSNNKIDSGMSASEWNKVSEIVGRSVKNAGQFFQLSSEQMAKLAEEDMSLYPKIKDLANNGYKDAAQYMDEYITYYKQLEELENAYNEKLTNTSFDSIRSDFKNALLDMESDAEDFTNNFEKMMQNAIVESLMTKKYDALIQAWYEDFAKAMEGDGKIDEDEQKTLQNKWNIITNKALEERDALKDAMGWTSGDSSSQEASKRDLASMSQDTGNELNGRFTAFQISNEEIKNSMLSMLSGVNLISTTTTANGITLMEIRNLAISSNSYLEDIAKYTKPLLEVGGKLDRIESNTKGLTSR